MLEKMLAVGGVCKTGSFFSVCAGDLPTGLARPADLLGVAGKAGAGGWPLKTQTFASGAGICFKSGTVALTVAGGV